MAKHTTYSASSMVVVYTKLLIFILISRLHTKTNFTFASSSSKRKNNCSNRQVMSLGIVKDSSFLLHSSSLG